MNSHRHHWGLDPETVFLNHGSFGACPREVREARQRWLDTLERQPVAFFERIYPDALDEARAALAGVIGAQADDLAFIPNATYGVNSVVASFPLRAGDEILVIDHAYKACHNAIDYVAARWGATVKVVAIPFPCHNEELIIERVLEAVTPRCVLAMLDWITSPTALRLPIERLVVELEARGVDTLVDAAHGVGLTPLQLDATGAAYTTGNCHKWLCTPKGSAFLHVRGDRRERVRPIAISHGASSDTVERSRFHHEFDWTGTTDPTPFLVIPDAIAFLERLEPGGMEGLMARNRALCLESRTRLAEHLGCELPCPDSMVAALAALPLEHADVPAGSQAAHEDPLHEWLWAQRRIEVPVFPWPAIGKRVLRISAAAYNVPGDYDRLMDALRDAPPELL